MDGTRGVNCIDARARSPKLLCKASEKLDLRALVMAKQLGTGN